MYMCVCVFIQGPRAAPSRHRHKGKQVKGGQETPTGRAAPLPVRTALDSGDASTSGF